ncbi:DUF4124 domain-containing protein [Pseudomonas sp. GD03842]|uniref:DUF4124 domain-containing protein n=1 Tax=Pseudomonas sp. GD03842 TaxID=2975385 RepID=UPI002446F94C|nr:DUF4124 domain-containing protein [Pseudomonas sp. GD03842]MDH0748717.1 DUF4124 domain-containing protein [Pseudomonas sp. GD03842]
MNGSVIASALLALSLSAMAYGEVFKCVAHDGRVSFASTPCPDYVGENRVQRPAQRLSSDWEPTDFPHRVNKNATEILQVSRRRRIIITNEKEISDHMQAIRPPPPGVPSTCVAPIYNSACFDPSGGSIRQPGKDAVRREPLGFSR